MSCIYLIASEEAVSITDKGESPIHVPLCDWADKAPEAKSLTNTPIWLQRYALSGIMHAADCINCSARKE